MALTCTKDGSVLALRYAARCLLLGVAWPNRKLHITHAETHFVVHIITRLAGHGPS